MRTRFRALPLYQRIGVRIVIYSALWGIFLKVVNEQPDLRRWAHAAVYKMQRSQGKDLPKLRMLFGIRSTFHNKADHFISAQNNSDEMYGLLKAGIDPNEKDPQGDHLMLHTIRSFNERGLRYLLESGADPNLASTQGETGLYTAVLQNNEPAFAMLLSHGADPNLMSRNTSLLTFAVRNNNERFFDLLVSHGADPQRPENRLLLFDAIASRSAALVTKVLGFGFDPNRIAAETGHSAMTEAEQCSDCSSVRAVLKEWEERREGRE